jgi:hypothetical protein
VIPVRPEASPVAAPEPTPTPVDPPIEVNSAPPASGLRILRDESYRRRFLQQLRERFDSEEKPVTGPAGS